MDSTTDVREGGDERDVLDGPAPAGVVSEHHAAGDAWIDRGTNVETAAANNTANSATTVAPPPPPSTTPQNNVGGGGGGALSLDTVLFLALLALAHEARRRRQRGFPNRRTAVLTGE